MLYNGNYKFLKIDVLAQLVRLNTSEFIYKSLEFLTQAYDKKMCLFYEFYYRFFTSWLDTISVDRSSDISYKPTVLKILEIICPSHFPGFAAHFIEIVKNSFFDKFSDVEMLWITEEAMSVLKYNEKFERLLFDFLQRREKFVEIYHKEINDLCPPRCAVLKNFLDKNANELEVANGIENYTEKQIKIICLKVLARFYTINPTESVKKAYEDICKNYQNVVTEYEERYFAAKQ